MNEKTLLFFSRWGLLLIVIIAIFFRLYNLPTTPPGLYPDEAMNGNNALEAISTGEYKIFYPENNGREGLFINIQAILLKIIRVNEPWVLRLGAVIFGILTVVGVWFLTKEILKKYKWASFVAFWSSFFLATSFWHINFSRIGFRANMAPMFLVWGLFFLIVALNRIKDNSQITNNQLLKNQNSNFKSLNLDIRTWILTVVGGLLYGAGMHSYIAYRITPLIIIFVFAVYWIAYKISFKKIIGLFFIYVIVAFLVFLPLGNYFIQHPADFMGRTSQVSIFSGPNPIKDLGVNVIKTLGMFNFVGDYNWRHNYSGAPELYWIVGFFLLFGFIGGIVRTFKYRLDQNYKEEKIIWLISIAWIIVAMLPVIISNEGIPHALRSILMIPPVYIIAGLGTYWILEAASRYQKPKTIGVAIIIIISLVTIQAYTTYFVAWAKNPNVQGAFAQHYVDIGRQINELPISADKYIIVNSGGTDVRGIPMPAQTIMFITDSFTPEKQNQKNIHYVLEKDLKSITQKDAVIFYLEPK